MKKPTKLKTRSRRRGKTLRLLPSIYEASQSSRPQARKGSDAFFAGTCASRKIPFAKRTVGSTWSLRGAERVPSQIGAQQSGSDLKRVDKALATRSGRRRAEALRLLLCLLPVLALSLALCACASPAGGAGGDSAPRPTGPSATPGAVPSPQPSAGGEPEPGAEEVRPFPENAMVIACEPFSGICDPFDDAEGSDLLLLRLTQTPLLCRRADGSFSETAEGTGAAGLRIVSRGDGSAALRIAMRENVRFADGSYADADDLIFTLYVLLDPDYTGQLDLRDCAIPGLKAYRTGADPARLEEFEALYAEAAAGEGPMAVLTKLCLREAWGVSIRTLTERCRSALAGHAGEALGLSPEEAAQQPGALRAFVLWRAGLAEPADARGKMRDALGNQWDPAKGVLPEEDYLIDLFTQIYGSTEACDEALGLETARLAEESFLRRCAGADSANVPPARVSGIRRVDDYTVDIRLDSCSQADLEKLGKLWLLPMRAYGDADLFRPEEGSYGFPYGDLSALRKRIGEPAPGAGAFRIAEGEEDFHLEANLFYFGGSPKVQEIWFETAPREELLQLVSEGSADLACLPGSRESFEQARELPGLALRSISTEEWQVLNLRRTPEGWDRAELAEAVLDLAAVCCRASAGEYFGGAALPVNTEKTEENALEALRQALGRLPEGGRRSFTALVPGGDRGEHPCRAGLERASELLAELGVELRLRDLGDGDEFQAALDAGEGDLWPSVEALGSLPEGQEPGPDKRAVCRMLDLLALNSGRFELLSLPVELSWARDHISVVETLELK